jgi:hypothetical protein
VFDSQGVRYTGPLTNTMSGPSGGGTWSYLSPGDTVTVPNSGYVTWRVIAADGLLNQSTTTGPTILETLDSGVCW